MMPTIKVTRRIKNAPKPEKSEARLTAISSPNLPARAAPRSVIKMRVSPTVTCGLISFNLAVLKKCEDSRSAIIGMKMARIPK